MATSDFTTKRCSKCKQRFPATTEYFHRCNRDGFQSTCKACRKAEDKSKSNQKLKERYHNDPEYRARILERVNNPEVRDRQNQLRRERYANDPEYREKARRQNRESARAKKALLPPPPPKEKRPPFDVQAYRREYKSRPEVKAKARAYNHRPEVKARTAELRQTPERKERERRYSRLQYVRKLARKSQLPNDFTEADWQYMIDYWHDCCAICERPMRDLFGILEPSIDHWTPVVRGGGTVPDNILPMCHGAGGCNTSKNARDPIEWLTEKLGKRKAKQKLKEIEAFFASVRKIN